MKHRGNKPFLTPEQMEHFAHLRATTRMLDDELATVLNDAYCLSLTARMLKSIAERNGMLAPLRDRRYVRPLAERQNDLIAAVTLRERRPEPDRVRRVAPGTHAAGRFSMLSGRHATDAASMPEQTLPKFTPSPLSTPTTPHQYRQTTSTRA